MKKTKNISIIALIIGVILIIIGILCNTFLSEEKEYKAKKNHKPIEKEFCEDVDYKEQASFVLPSNLNEAIALDNTYALVTTPEEFYTASNLFVYYEEDLNIDLNNYDYIFYYRNNGNSCARSKILTKYTLSGQNLNLELTNSDSNQSECSYETVYAYAIPFEDGTITQTDLIINIENKEDPYKECYNK